MTDEPVTGWDLGGAHLKVAQAEAGGRLVAALQLPCTLWLGLEHLDRALAEAGRRLRPTRRHAVTMTGELTDLFAGRAEGVRRLVEAVARAFPDAELGIYAGEAGFLTPAEAVARPRLVASANWHAAARFAAARLGAALFVDVGSTTTDIVPVAGGRVRALGTSDDERLAAEELVYSGATRTPVMALADGVPFAGRRQRLMAELFATAADVHRLTGALPNDADQLPTADGRGKTAEDSARRLARMLGCDLEDAGMAAWRGLARHLAERQRRLLQDAMERVLSHGLLAGTAPIVGAGIGRFLLPELARRLHRPYADFADLVAGDPEVREWAARCAPAAAVAALAAAE